MRYFLWCLTLLTIALAAGCGGNSTGDDASLSPQERAARFDAFAKQGISHTDLAKAFPPSRFCFGLVDAGGKHIGATSWTDYTPEKFSREMSSVQFDGFSFQYNWSEQPLVFSEAMFTRDGNLDHITRVGDFE